MILEKETVIIQPLSKSGAIDDAKRNATNFLSIDDSGIMVADMSNGTHSPSSPVGRNVFINSESVNIRNNSDIVASFGEKIYLYSGNNYTMVDSDGVSIFSNNTQVAKFTKNEIVLGDYSSRIKNVITGTRIAFVSDDGKTAASFGLNDDGIWEMRIGATYAEETLRFGNYAWEGRSNGNMTLKWLGE